MFCCLSLNPVVIGTKTHCRNIIFYLYSLPDCVNPKSASKFIASPAKTKQVCSYFCQKEPARNEIRFPSFGRHLEFHFYLSIMHEVAQIRPRSARLPVRATPINTTTLICLSHLCQPRTTSLQWLHSVKLRLSTFKTGCYATYTIRCI